MIAYPRTRLGLRHGRFAKARQLAEDHPDDPVLAPLRDAVAAALAILVNLPRPILPENYIHGPPGTKGSPIPRDLMAYIDAQCVAIRAWRAVRWLRSPLPIDEPKEPERRKTDVSKVLATMKEGDRLSDSIMDEGEPWF